MISRFILFVVLAKILSPDQLGIFGLINAGVAFFVLLVGVDFYTYSNRELLSISKSEYSRNIINQIYAYPIIYALIIPIITLIFYNNYLPWSYLSWFLILIIMEHISTEQNRILNTLQKQLSASLVMFLRSASWIIIALPFIYFNESYQNVEVLLFSWIIGLSTSILVGGIIIAKYISGWKLYAPDLKWIQNGYKTGLLFLLGTLSFQAITTFDKYWLEILSNSKIVGVYVFYFTVIIGANAFIHAGLIVFSSPKIIKAYQSGDIIKFQKLSNIFFKKLLLATILVVVTLIILTPFVIEWINKPLYQNYYNLFYIIAFIGAIMVITNHPHTYLYAIKKDKYILFSNISSFIIFALTLWGANHYIPTYEAIYVVSTSLCIAIFGLMILKYMGYLYFYKKVIAS